MKFFELKMRLIAPLVVVCCLIGAGSQMAQAQTYTSDTNIGDFTSGITTYATFSNYSGNTGCTAAPFTPTSSELATTSCRVFGGSTLTGLPTTPVGQNWILASFSSPTSTIMVFPNIDHYGSAYDGYQYQIYGSNDLSTWTQLFDATSVNPCSSNCVVNGTGEPFTLGTSTGTRPSTVNNVLTPQSGSIEPCSGTATKCSVGYIAQFLFPAAYKYYAFGASTVAFGNNPNPNPDQELSAVGAITITQPLNGNAAVNTFAFPFATYDVIYPADVSIAANTTMTISAIMLSQTDCNGHVQTVQLVGGSPTAPPAGSSCTTYTNLNNQSAIFDITCLAPTTTTPTPTSGQCTTTTGFNPFSSTGFHSGEDISNIVNYTGPNVNLAAFAPQMLTAAEATPTTWVPIGVGYAPSFSNPDPTTGGGTSSWNSLIVSFNFARPTTGPSPFAIPPYTSQGSTFFEPPVADPPTVNVAKAGSTVPIKFCINYGTNTALGFNGGPYTTLNFPPLGYFSIMATQVSTGTLSTSTDNIILDTQTTAGLLNLGNGCYNFGWKTQKSFAGLSFIVTVGLGDGVRHDFDVMFQ